MPRFRCASALVSLLSAAAGTPLLHGTLTADGYSVSLNGRVVLVGSTFALHADGAWHVHTGDDAAAAARGGAQPLVPQSAPTNISGTDEYGAWSGVELQWLAGAGRTSLATRVKNYAQHGGEMVVFEASLPHGASRTNHSSSSSSGGQHGVLTNFPLLNATASMAAELRGALSWEGEFIGPKLHGRSYGASGGPTVWYGGGSGAADGGGGSGGGGGGGLSGEVLIGSALNHFKTAGAAEAAWDGSAADWAPGQAATVASLPAGFTQRIALFGGTRGVTDTLWRWGNALLAAHRTTRAADFTLRRISYQTDNGAEYCFCTADCDAKLLRVAADLAAHGVELGSLSFQGGWWENKNIHTPRAAPWCVTSWAANKTKVPMGVKAFAAALGLPLQLYAPYFCADTSYAAAWPMLASDTSLAGCGGGVPFDFRTVAPDSSRSFYDFFLRYGQSVGMASFEPDFLHQNYICVPEFLANVSASVTWLRGMADAAHALAVPVQFCMATPSDLLASLDFPAVTNFRVSTDFYYGASYDVGVSSLLVWALGANPSKDTFWTTDNAAAALHDPSSGGPIGLGGCPPEGCPADHSNASMELHSIVAALTAGPVGFSDALGCTNYTLLRKLTTDRGGLLLRPSKPATTVDSRLAPPPSAGADSAPAASASGGGGSGGGGDVLGTFSGVASRDSSSAPPAPWAWYVLSYGLAAKGGEGGKGGGYAMPATDLWPRLPPAGLSLAHRQHRWGRDPAVAAADGGYGFCAHGAPAATCVVLQTVRPTGGSADSILLPAMANASEPLVPTLTTLAPVCASGVALLGDLRKFVALSADRFTGVACGPKGVLAFTVLGVAGERVPVTMLSPSMPAPGGQQTHAAPSELWVKVQTVEIPASGKVSLTIQP
jgi:hypothetical protein